MKLSDDNWNQCPIRYCAGIFGDKWVLVILRDLMFRGKNNFKALLASSEGISTNILADRLKKMEQHGLVDCIANNEDARGKLYQLTEKGWDLVPVMLSFFDWAHKHDPETYLTPSVIASFAEDRETIKANFRSGQTLSLSDSEK